MSDKITLSPICSPFTISTVFTDVRPSCTWTRTAAAPSSTTLNKPTVLFASPCTGRPTYSTSASRSISTVPSTLRSGRAPCGSGPSSATSTVTVPFTTAGSIRITCPAITPLCVSTEAFCPMVMSFACVSAILSCAFKCVGCATRASTVPCVTFCPTSTSSSCSTPSIPGRTFS